MSNWYKGNIHTHTTKSDGDADPEVVVEWFKEHGYDFLVLSDHNHRTILEHEVDAGPLMIPGEEVSARIQVGSVPIHVNGIGISRLVEPFHGEEIVETIQGNVNAILDAGGIASINHPNYQWAFDHTHVRQGRRREPHRGLQRLSNNEQRRRSRQVHGRRDLGRSAHGRQAHLRRGV